MSGLGTIRRDFSQNSANPSSRGSTRDEPIAIDWPPSPPREKLTGMQLRMKAIEEAMGYATASKPSQPLAQSRAFNKRPSDPALLFDDGDAPPQKKKRELPSSWKEDSSSKTFTSRSSSSSVKAQIRDIPHAGGTSKPTKRLAGVFLSQEQSEILRLVEDGLSVFYTGSAGVYL